MKVTEWHCSVVIFHGFKQTFGGGGGRKKWEKSNASNKKMYFSHWTNQDSHYPGKQITAVEVSITEIV